jgi:hypothetical protein
VESLAETPRRCRNCRVGTGEDTRRLTKSHDGEIWLWKGVTLQLHYTEFSDPIEGSSYILRLRAPSLRASYRGIDKTIRHDMGGLLAELERVPHICGDRVS